MECLKFNKRELVNLEYALKREVLATNRAGGYCSTTIVCCNTRKYHGLLVLPTGDSGGDNHVLLSALDETIVHEGQAFNLGIHKYPGTYYPKGHKYIVDFECAPVFSLLYQIGGVLLKKEILMAHNEPLVMLRYTLLEAHTDLRLQLKPYLAYRRVHELSKANFYANTKYTEIPQGIRSNLYAHYPDLNMQLSRKGEFVSVPDWYYHVEYTEEQQRGYDFQEDLFVPGYFELVLKPGESVIFSASLEEQNPAMLSRKFQQMRAKRQPRGSFEECLAYSASQFIVQDEKDTEVVAGYPWFGRWGRDTFIALPGITLASNYNPQAFKGVMDTMCRQLHNGLFPNIGKPPRAAYNSVDAPLWFFWALQQYEKALGSKAGVWKNWGECMRQILCAFRDGVNPGIRMEENGLIWAKIPGKALTWMDAVVGDTPVTARAGFAVEINALWYNAVCYTLELARRARAQEFVKEWEALPQHIIEHFIKTFWYPEGRYLADYVDENGQNVFVRPNQVFACSMPYSPLTEEMQADVLRIVGRELLTPWGLRTLSPKNPLYQGLYEGDQPTRDRAYHQGTVWPWLSGAYIEANLKLRGKQFLPIAGEMMRAFQEDLTLYGLCSIAEVYDGNPPHRPNGSISQAWSVGEVLRVLQLMKQYENTTGVG